MRPDVWQVSAHTGAGQMLPGVIEGYLDAGGAAAEETCGGLACR
jgi:hypothetical protein